MGEVVSPSLKSAVVPICALFPMGCVAAVPSSAQQSIGADSTLLGAGFGAFFLTSAISAGIFGPRVSRERLRSDSRLALILTATSLLILAWVDVGWPTFLLAMLVAGISNGASHSIANVLLDDQLPSGRRGFGFGIKQVAVPASLMLAGLSAPWIIEELGWTLGITTYACVVLLTAASVPMTPTSIGRAQGEAGSPTFGAPVISTSALVCAGFLATLMTGALSSFFPLALRSAGVGTHLAGLMFAAASACALLVRLLAGWTVDAIGVKSPSRQLLIVAAMLGVGSLATLGLGVSGPVQTSLLGIVAFAVGWGWPGLFHLGIVALSPDVGRTTGHALVGVFLGAVAGPALFGYLASYASAGLAWAVVGTSGVLGSLVFLSAAARPAFRGWGR